MHFKEFENESFLKHSGKSFQGHWSNAILTHGNLFVLNFNASSKKVTLKIHMASVMASGNANDNVQLIE